MLPGALRNRHGQGCLWTDLNGDGRPDLLLAGEWMPLTVLLQENGKLVNRTSEYFPQPLVGWWNCLRAADLDGDGRTDILAGNLGLNYKYKASFEKPFHIYADDFDGNGTFDIALGAYYGNILYPVRGRSCSSEQMPLLKKKFPTFSDFARADLAQVYGEGLSQAVHYEATFFSNAIFYQEESGKFSIVELPRLCQTAPVNDAVIFDLNGDQRPDLILGGNLYQSEIETGRADAGTGRVVLNKGGREWEPLPVYESGLFLDGDLKSLALIRRGPQQASLLIAGNNKAPCQVVALPSSDERFPSERLSLK
ncbi:MAG: VCBS repeat-containing protein [Deltaproteobacteria bacterium]|nr:MAG: VCBS repeat-containing protein [Deltaproteobacteria bacterium]